MNSDDFDPLATVVFEPRTTGERKPAKGFQPLVSSCSVIDYRDEKIHLKASTNQPGYLVLSEIFYPGWQAVVDGKKVPILCGNYLFRVIPLSRVRFLAFPHRCHHIPFELRFVSGSPLTRKRKQKGVTFLSASGFLSWPVYSAVVSSERY